MPASQTLLLPPGLLPAAPSGGAPPEPQDPPADTTAAPTGGVEGSSPEEGPPAAPCQGSNTVRAKALDPAAVGGAQGGTEGGSQVTGTQTGMPAAVGGAQGVVLAPREGAPAPEDSELVTGGQEPREGLLHQAQPDQAQSDQARDVGAAEAGPMVAGAQSAAALLAAAGGGVPNQAQQPNQAQDAGAAEEVSAGEAAPKGVALLAQLASVAGGAPPPEAGSYPQLLQAFDVTVSGVHAPIDVCVRCIAALLGVLCAVQLSWIDLHILVPKTSCLLLSMLGCIKQGVL